MVDQIELDTERRRGFALIKSDLVVDAPETDLMGAARLWFSREELAGLRLFSQKLLAALPVS